MAHSWCHRGPLGLWRWLGLAAAVLLWGPRVGLGADLDGGTVAMPVAESTSAGTVPDVGALTFPDIHVGGLLQPQALLEVDPVGTTPRSLRFTPFVRRARFTLHGTLSPRVNFFVQSDVPNTGLRNDWSPRFFLNDLLVEFNLGPQLQLDAGLLLLPTSHAGASASPMTLGVNAPQVFFAQEITAIAADESIIPSQQALRDVGLMARGELTGLHLEYRLALTAGLSKFVGNTPTNPHAIPRLTGRLVYNFFAAMAGPTFRGLYYPGVHLQDSGGSLLSPKRVVNLGVSASYQPSAIALPGGGTAAFALGDLDLFVDLPLGDGTQAITGQADYALYRVGPRAGDLRHIFFAEAGYRYRRLAPLAALEVIANQPPTLGNSIYWRLGLNWWFLGHQANLKVDMGARRQTTPAAPAAGFVGIGHVATQVFF